MDFYFKYVLGLKEVDAVEDKMEANTFGTIVHEVLEVLYKEVKGQLLSPKHIQAWLPRIETELKRAIVKHWGSGQVESGFNYIGKEVAREYIQRFLNWEKNELLELEKGGKTLRIIDLEQYLEGVIEVPVMNSTIQVKLRGVVDRIDEVDGQVRIIDYKTGGVSPSDLKISPTLEELAENSKPKALQVLIYKYLFAQNHKANWSDVKAGVFSLKQMNNGMMFLQPTSKKIDPLEFQQSIEQNFTRSFEQILGMMLDPEAVWEHQEKSDFCAYCDS